VEPGKINYRKRMFKYKLAVKKTNLRHKKLVNRSPLDYVDNVLVYLRASGSVEYARKFIHAKRIKVNSKNISADYLLKKYDLLSIETPRYRFW